MDLFIGTASKEYSQYMNLAAAHSLSQTVLFSPAARKWTSFDPACFTACGSLRAKACYENGIKEVLATLWGDSNSEASLFSVLPVIQLFAECGFHEEVNDGYLARRLRPAAAVWKIFAAGLFPAEHDRKTQSVQILILSGCYARSVR